MQREDATLWGKLLKTTTQTRQSSLEEKRSPHALQNTFLPHLLCTQHWGTSLSSQLLQEREAENCMQNGFVPCRINSKYQDKIFSCPLTVSIFLGWRSMVIWLQNLLIGVQPIRFLQGSSWRSNTTLGNGVTSLPEEQCCFRCLTLNKAWSLQGKRTAEL